MARLAEAARGGGGGRFFLDAMLAATELEVEAESVLDEFRAAGVCLSRLK